MKRAFVSNRCLSSQSGLPGVGSVAAQSILLEMFNVPELKRVAQEVEDTIVKIMTEAIAS